MGLFDSAVLLKIQENLLHKGDQNKTESLHLGRVLLVAKYIAKTASLPCIDDLVSWCEDQQMVIGGRSRKEFAETLKHIPIENNLVPENKNK